MNKRLLKKKANQSIKQINKLKLSTGDNIVLRFDMKEIKPEQIGHMVDYFHRQFPDNKVIALPNSITSIRKLDRISFIKFLERMLDEAKIQG